MAKGKPVLADENPYRCTGGVQHARTNDRYSLQKAYRSTQLPGCFLAQIWVLYSNDIEMARVANVDVGTGQWASAALLPVGQHYLAHLIVSLQPHITFSHCHSQHTKQATLHIQTFYEDTPRANKAEPAHWNRL